MDAIETLRREHRVIETVLVALDRMAGRLEAEHPFARERAEHALEILRKYADECHQRKEEEHLLRLLRERAVAGEGELIATLVREHEQARAHLHRMARTLVGASENDPQAGPTFVRHARAYVSLLRQHMRKESEIIFPAAEQRLSQEDDADLAGEFARVEAAEIGEGVHERYQRWAQDLADRNE